MFSAVAARRLISVGRRSVSTALPKPNYHQMSRQAWLGDSSTYPLLFCLTCAIGVVVGASVNAFTTYKDVRILPSNRHQVIQVQRDPNKHTTLTERFASNTYHTQGKGLGTEGW